jgi:hypothetical protein
MRQPPFPAANTFEKEIRARLAKAKKQSSAHLEVNAGELHRTLGGYPGVGHHMPSCCQVMKRLMQTPPDVIVQSPPKGRGASLTVRYYLPRGAGN